MVRLCEIPVITRAQPCMQKLPNAANDKRLSGQLSALTNSCGVKTEKYFKRVKLQRLPPIRPLPSGSAILARLSETGHVYSSGIACTISSESRNSISYLGNSENQTRLVTGIMQMCGCGCRTCKMRRNIAEIIICICHRYRD